MDDVEKEVILGAGEPWWEQAPVTPKGGPMAPMGKVHCEHSSKSNWTICGGGAGGSGS